MKQVVQILSIALISVFLMAGNCKKGGGGGGGGTTEATLAVTLSPAAGSNQAPAPGPDFPLTVTITSTMPSGGVKIDVVAKIDGGANFFTESRNSSSATNNFTITSSPKTVTLRVEVTVTSLSLSTNKFTGSFTYSRK